jgi:hypothetical protein
MIENRGKFEKERMWPFEKIGTNRLEVSDRLERTDINILVILRTR